MKIWIVEECIEYEGIMSYEVFLSEEGAFLYREEQIKKSIDCGYIPCKNNKCQRTCKQCVDFFKSWEKQWIIVEKETRE